MHDNCRRVCSGSDTKSIRAALMSRALYTNTKPIPNASKLPIVIFVFTGQGSKYVGIGKQLYLVLSRFRADIQRFDRIARQQGFPRFLSLVDGSVTSIKAEESVFAHLALTCVQIILFRLWLSWGVTSNTTIGHSLVEHAVLYVTGVLMASDTICLGRTRAQLLLRHCIRGSSFMLGMKASLNVT